MQRLRRSASAACAAVDADKQLKSDAALVSADCAAAIWKAYKQNKKGIKSGRQ